MLNAIKLKTLASYIFGMVNSSVQVNGSGVAAFCEIIWLLHDLFIFFFLCMHTYFATLASRVTHH